MKIANIFSIDSCCGEVPTTSESKRATLAGAPSMDPGREPAMGSTRLFRINEYSLVYIVGPLSIPLTNQ